MLTNFELSQFLISVVALLIMAHSVGYAFERMALPRVIGEICGGFLLGPSVLGLVFPDVAGSLVPSRDCQKFAIDGQIKLRVPRLQSGKVEGKYGFCVV